MWAGSPGSFENNQTDVIFPVDMLLDPSHSFDKTLKAQIMIIQ